jgi:hypothetical protein
VQWNNWLSSIYGYDLQYSCMNRISTIKSQHKIKPQQPNNFHILILLLLLHHSRPILTKIFLINIFHNSLLWLLHHWNLIAWDKYFNESAIFDNYSFPGNFSLWWFWTTPVDIKMLQSNLWSFIFSFGIINFMFSKLFLSKMIATNNWFNIFIIMLYFSIYDLISPDC